VVHLQVILRAAFFGVLAYGVIRLLVYLSQQAGLLDWMR
jgi:hypothetical protein